MITLTQSQIMQNWGVDNAENPLVSVRCITYNHEPYIAQALDGFLMQKTNFPFEVIVHDDASTDKTAEIIREYEKKFPKIIKPIYEKENQYSKHDGSLGRIVNSALKGKYVAMCEGDDYWIDENKLQMQVDFLEGNPEYGMCYTDYNVYYQNKRKMQYDLFKSRINPLSKEITLANWIYEMGYIAPMTWVFKKSLFDSYNSFNSLDGTFVMVAHFLAKSKIKYLMKTTSVYRILQESASHSIDLDKLTERAENLYKTQILLIDKYLKQNVQNENLKKLCTEKYYKSHFYLFSANNDKVSLDKSMEYCKDSSVKKLIYILEKTRLGRKLFTNFYIQKRKFSMNSILKHQKTIKFVVKKSVWR